MGSKFKIGDKVVVVKKVFTDEEWEGVGKIDTPFSIGDILIINEAAARWVTFKFNESSSGAYPVSGFEHYLDNIKAKTESEDLTYLANMLEKLDIKW